MRGGWRAVWILLTAATLVMGRHTPAVTAPQSGEIVLYASDVAAISGNWRREPSTTGAGGLKMTSTDGGVEDAVPARAHPTDYFEIDFEAEGGIDYRLWLRMRAAADNKWNDSVWVQFSGAVDPGGAPLWRIGTSDARLVNLENCYACGMSGWGWQDGAWYLEQPATVRFASSGRQRIRIQLREDGVDIDQIVLSAGAFRSSAPGQRTNDTTIVPRSVSTSLLRQSYIQYVTETSAVVVWTTREVRGGELRVADPSGAAFTRAPETRLFQASLTGLPYDYYQHEAWVTGLRPATRYGYSIVRDGTTLTAGDGFATAPLRGTGSARFIAFGDSGVGSTAQRQLADRMAADVFDLSLHAGDVVYGSSTMRGGGSYPQYDVWFFDIYSRWLRSRPFYPSIGNHDEEVEQARPYRDMFVLPANGASGAYPDHAERFYSFDYGPVHFIALDTELAFRDPARRQAQLQWLEQDLASTVQPWRVAYMHRPPYSAGAHHGSDLEVRRYFSPLFEKYGVQLAITAHEHAYERTIPLREHTTAGSPVTYIVTGGGGATLYPAGSARWTAFSASVHHYVRGHATECALRIEAVSIDGSVFDSSTLDRCGSAPPAQLRDVVLYATDVTTVSGNWARLPSSSGANQVKMASADHGWAAIDAPVAAPQHYFEADFDAPAGSYRLWLRMRGAADSKWNESVWVQFSNATTAQGAPLWRIGTSQALLVNLEDCGGCGIQNWGWQDNAWWLEESSVVTLPTTGRHTIRIQTREDGVEIDQIVLSPQRYLSTPPGSVRADGTIVAK